MLRAGDGLNLNFDGSQIEISLARPDWFVAKITGHAGSTPVKHSWIRQQLKANGTYEDTNPKVEGTTTNCPAYLPDGSTQANGLVFMRQRGVGGSGQTEYEILAGTSAASGGNAVIDVVSAVTCTPTGIEVSMVTLSGADYDNAVIRNFLALSDVTPKSFLGNQGRAVVVNASGSALEFGPILGEIADTFISLSDTPLEYGKDNTYKVLTVSSSNAAVVFSDNDVVTGGSITGGGNPNNPSKWVDLRLAGDLDNPGKDKYYGTNASSTRGWYPIPDIVTLETRVDTLENTVSDLQNDVSGLQTTVAGHTTKITSLETLTASHSTKITTLEGKVSAAESNILTLQSSVSGLEITVAGHTSSISSLQYDVGVLQTTVSGNSSSITNLGSRVSAIENAPYASEAYVNGKIQTEATARSGADSLLDGRVTVLEGTVAGHTTSISTLATGLTNAQGSISTLQGQMTTAQGDISVLQSGLSTEITNRTNADNVLSGRITTAEGTLTSHTSTLAAHGSDITTLQNNLATETNNRTNADNALDGRLDTLEGQTLDTRLSTLEGQTLNTRLNTLESQTLDTRLSTLEGQTLDTRISTLEGQTLDTRLATLEGQTLDTRLTTLEGQTLDSRVTTLEGQTLDSRLTTLEGQTLDTRVTTLEGLVSSTALTLSGTQVVGVQQSAIADAVGSTIDDTSVADCASSTQTAVDDLKTQLNAVLAALRTHGLIAT